MNELQGKQFSSQKVAKGTVFPAFLKAIEIWLQKTIEFKNEVDKIKPWRESYHVQNANSR